MSKKQVRTEPITAELDGVVYHGSRTIEGSRKLMQQIHYGLKSRWDSKRYDSDGSYMKGIARVILLELAQEKD